MRIEIKRYFLEIVSVNCINPKSLCWLLLTVLLKFREVDLSSKLEYKVVISRFHTYSGASFTVYCSMEITNCFCHWHKNSVISTFSLNWLDEKHFPHVLRYVWCVWKFIITVFWQKFRESNDFTQEITKELVSRNFCQINSFHSAEIAEILSHFFRKYSWK